MHDLAKKISAIIAKADSSTHPEEAAAFMAKAQQLMIENGLSMLDLGKLDQDDPLGKNTDRGDHEREAWRWIVGAALASYYGCKAIRMNRRGDPYHTWYVYGRESARVTFDLMYPFVDRQIMALARDAAKRGAYKSTSRARTAIASALAYRIYSMQEEEQKSATEGRGLHALVPVDLIKQMIAEDFGKVGVTKAGAKAITTADLNLANKVSINLQTTQYNNKQIGA